VAGCSTGTGTLFAGDRLLLSSRRNPSATSGFKSSPPMSTIRARARSRRTLHGRATSSRQRDQAGAILHQGKGRLSGAESPSATW
jgi:hypothetical protein